MHVWHWFSLVSFGTCSSYGVQFDMGSSTYNRLMLVFDASGVVVHRVFSCFWSCGRIRVTRTCSSVDRLRVVNCSFFVSHGCCSCTCGHCGAVSLFLCEILDVFRVLDDSFLPTTPSFWLQFRMLRLVKRCVFCMLLLLLRAVVDVHGAFWFVSTPTSVSH